MRDIVITREVRVKEIIIILISLTVAQCLNIYSIIKYDTEWSELWTELHITIALGIAVYILLAVIRLLMKIFKRSKRGTNRSKRY